METVSVFSIKIVKGTSKREFILVDEIAFHSKLKTNL